MITRFYRTPALANVPLRLLVDRAQQSISRFIQEITTEFCFYVESISPLDEDASSLLRWLLSETFEPECFGTKSFLPAGLVLEVGPRLSFTTPWSTNAVSICQACGLKTINRIERFRRYRLECETPLSEDKQVAFLSLVHDRMTECWYPEPLTTFETGIQPAPVQVYPVMERGAAAVVEANRTLGLGMDSWDIDYYTSLFADVLQRNPTDVELFQLGQANSEHSRHHFFRGRLVIDGQEAPQNLLKVVQDTLAANPSNSVIAFRDNSSAIRGASTSTIRPATPGRPSPFIETRPEYLPVLTAETHNFPSGVAPYPGAETGTGGRIRDNQAVGRGGLVVAGTTGYCVGQLLIPGYPLPWENSEWPYPGNLASPLDIEIRASDGASDYGNCFGEPVVAGFTRSFGLRLGNERREWIKPIMFTAGVGQMDSRHTEKAAPKPQMLVVQVGGPAYRIGMGGGAASSMIQGQNTEELDFSAVQRGDPEMEQRMNRVVRACIELGDDNPILSVHDLGAGGDCNAVTEIVEPAGGLINLRRIPTGDATLSPLEIWGNESQERIVCLVDSSRLEAFASLCHRERAPYALIGEITGDGKIVVYDDRDGSTPVNLDLEKILGKMPRKSFELERRPTARQPLALPADITVEAALRRVLRLLSVGSKRFLTNKVDRSVTGLVAQQQCVGPLQLTLADFAMVAHSHFALTGTAISIGEQPVKGLVDAAAMARMSVAEAVTNLVWARITSLSDVKCSANWMWAAKLPGEGARLYDAALAMRDTMITLGVAVDGGKDSLSMAAQVSGLSEATETVKAPGALVISTYAFCPDINRKVTPDFKRAGKSHILLVDLSGGQRRLGGSALAQVYGQVGDQTPDLEYPDQLKAAFEVTQSLLDDGAILAGHDRSDGGLLTTVLEMAFAGNCGVKLDFPGIAVGEAISFLFNEEVGLVIECAPQNSPALTERFGRRGLTCLHIGETRNDKRIEVVCGGHTVLDGDMRDYRHVWEETSYQIERLQANPECAEQEWRHNWDRSGPGYYSPVEVIHRKRGNQPKPKAAIIREEGSNGDREMVSAFFLAGFEPWDVTMTDLLGGEIDLNRDGFRGAVFVGGFSYKDVCDAAKGWAGSIRFHQRLRDQFLAFYQHPDTFSLGVCNGCQLMALLGWVPGFDLPDEIQPRFIRNKSGRFESRFVSVKIGQSPAIMLEGMEGSLLGVWVAHGEGLFYSPDAAVFDRILAQNMAPVRFVNDFGQESEDYPFNPNGSPLGIAALCSPDGRHLAIMPHPERAFLNWQWPYLPEGWDRTAPSPWLRMFLNARQWCDRR
jgi:phosphoribosylformylglycinamidine synthase